MFALSLSMVALYSVSVSLAALVASLAPNKEAVHFIMSAPYTVSNVIPTDSNVCHEPRPLSNCFHTGTVFCPSALSWEFSVLMRWIASANIGKLFDMARNPVLNDTAKAGASRVNWFNDAKSIWLDLS